MARLPLFGFGIAAKSPFCTAKHLQNIYAEQRPVGIGAPGEKSMLVAYQTPGLTLFADVGATPWRGGIEFEPGGVAYAVHRGTLYEINNAGITTARGALLTVAGRVSLSHNGVQVMITDGTAGYIYNTQTLVFAQIVDPDFPANPVTVCYLGRRFVVNFAGSSRFYCSDIDNGLSWDALNFANAESNPDPIVAVLSTSSQIILLGTVTTEFWGNSGTADFPFAMLQGTANEWGLAATWSLAKYDNSFAMLVHNRMGQVMVAKMNGYLPEKISTVDVDSIFNKIANPAIATSYSYMLGGHAMYVITFPDSQTWLFDGATGFWSQLKSFGLPFHRIVFCFTLLGATIGADFNTGRLYKITATALDDNGDSIEKELISENVADPDLSRIGVDKFRLDMEVGDGLAVGQGSDPQIGLQVSRDNGKTWGAQMWKSCGKAGEYKTRVEWRRLGTARAYNFKVSFTDPLPLTIISASLNPED